MIPLAELLAKASPGPWVNGERILPEDNCAALALEEHADIYRVTADGNCNVACATFSQADADLVVALRNEAEHMLAAAQENAWLKTALDAANAIIGEAADEAKRLQDRIEELERQVAEAGKHIDQIDAILCPVRVALEKQSSCIQRLVDADATRRVLAETRPVVSARPIDNFMAGLQLIRDRVTLADFYNASCQAFFALKSPLSLDEQSMLTSLGFRVGVDADCVYRSDLGEK